MKLDYLELPECKPKWEYSVPRCSKDCPSACKGTCIYLAHFVSGGDICIPLVQHMKHVLDKFQQEDQETEDMLKGLKEGGGVHG